MLSLWWWIPIKITNNTGFTNFIYSSGLTAKYVSIDNTVVNFTKSLYGYNRVLGVMPAVYSAYTCEAPYVYGSACDYEISLTSGSSLTTKNIGEIYLSDVFGDTLSVPIFVGYNLILDQQSIETEGSDLVTFVAKVATPDSYTGLSLANLPKCVKVIQSWDKLLALGDSCSFKLNFSGVEPGNYVIYVKGNGTNGQIKDNDIEKLSISVTIPWKPMRR